MTKSISPDRVRRLFAFGSAFALFMVFPAFTAGQEREPTAREAARDVGFQRIDDLVEQVRKKHDAIALAGAVVNDWGLVAIGVAGMREAGSKIPVEINDKFHIGSCTKSMTATLCAMLVEQKKLSWNTTIEESFPELKDKIKPAYLPVTLEQLVCHRGGLPEDGKPGATFFQILALQGEIGEKRLKAVELLLNEEPASRPGEKFIYSNAGFVIAGVMAERAMGKSWETLMAEHLFKPLGMETAGFGAPGSAEVIDQPRGHGGGLLGGRNAAAPGPFADNPEVLGPAGRVHCSMIDWGKYASIHLAGTGSDTLSLPRSALEKLHGDPFDQKYGFGWGHIKADWADGDVLAHAGSNTRWFARIQLDMGRKMGYLTAANHGDEAAVTAVKELLPELVKWSKENAGGAE